MEEIQNFYTWPFDAASIILRYFVLAGISYFIFYSWKKKFFSRMKIQKNFPRTNFILQEIFYSILTLLIYCAVSWFVFEWQKLGHTKIYLDIEKYGYFYFAASIILMVVIHDAYFYWTHRLMHIPILFKWVHKTHHHSHNPTPWSAFSFHPLEAVISVGIIPVIVFVIPCHPFALFVFLSFMTLINVVGHLGYETFPARIKTHKLGKWQNTSTNHNIHHQRATHNFGLYFTFWDRVMHTYFKSQ